MSRRTRTKTKDPNDWPEPEPADAPAAAPAPSSRRTRTKTKDPNDIPEEPAQVAAPISRRTRTKTKDPNDAVPEDEVRRPTENIVDEGPSDAQGISNAPYAIEDVADDSDATLFQRYGSSASLSSDADGPLYGSDAGGPLYGSPNAGTFGAHAGAGAVIDAGAESLPHRHVSYSDLPQHFPSTAVVDAGAESLPERHVSYSALPQHIASTAVIDAGHLPQHHVSYSSLPQHVASSAVIDADGGDLPRRHSSYLLQHHGSLASIGSQNSFLEDDEKLRDAGSASPTSPSSPSGLRRIFTRAFTEEMVVEDVNSSGDEQHRQSAADFNHLRTMGNFQIEDSKQLEVTALPGAMGQRGSIPASDRNSMASIDTWIPPADDDDEEDGHLGVNAVVSDISARELIPDHVLEDPLEGLVEINKPHYICAMTFLYYWAALAAGVLFGNVYQYIFIDATELAKLAADAAQKNAQVQLAEGLSPAVSMMRALDLAFRTGAVTSRMDYVGINRVLGPHFLLQPSLMEVELVEPPELPESGGRYSLLVSRAKCTTNTSSLSCAEDALLDLQTFWENCTDSTGCSYPESDTFRHWYETGKEFGARQGTWYGPCVGSCMAASYSWVGRISGGRRALLSAHEDPVSQFVSRVTINTQAFSSVAHRVGDMSRADKGGTVMICSHKGVVLEGIGAEGSALHTMPKIWDLNAKWTRAATSDFVHAGSGSGVRIQGYTLTAYKLQPDWNLRLVLAVPNNVFEDKFLGPFHPVAIVACAIPVLGGVLMVIRSLYMKCMRRQKKSKIMAAASSMRMHGHSMKTACINDALSAFDKEAALNKLNFQDLRPKDTGFTKKSIVFGTSFRWSTKGPAKAQAPHMSGSLPIDGPIAPAAGFKAWLNRRPTANATNDNLSRNLRARGFLSRLSGTKSSH